MPDPQSTDSSVQDFANLSAALTGFQPAFIRPFLDPTDLADFLLASWQGAILRMKVERSPAALERFKSIVFETVFSETVKEQA